MNLCTAPSTTTSFRSPHTHTLHSQIFYYYYASTHDAGVSYFCISVQKRVYKPLMIRRRRMWLTKYRIITHQRIITTTTIIMQLQCLFALPQCALLFGGLWLLISVLVSVPMTSPPFPCPVKLCLLFSCVSACEVTTSAERRRRDWIDWIWIYTRLLYSPGIFPDGQLFDRMDTRDSGRYKVRPVPPKLLMARLNLVIRACLHR